MLQSRPIFFAKNAEISFAGNHIYCARGKELYIMPIGESEITDEYRARLYFCEELAACNLARMKFFGNEEFGKFHETAGFIFGHISLGRTIIIRGDQYCILPQKFFAVFCRGEFLFIVFSRYIYKFRIAGERLICEKYIYLPYVVVNAYVDNTMMIIGRSDRIFIKSNCDDELHLCEILRQESGGDIIYFDKLRNVFDNDGELVIISGGANISNGLTAFPYSHACEIAPPHIFLKKYSADYSREIYNYNINLALPFRPHSIEWNSRRIIIAKSEDGNVFAAKIILPNLNCRELISAEERRLMIFVACLVDVNKNVLGEILLAVLNHIGIKNLI